ncbi:site-specific DNA-methyltransferase [Phaeobacter porticola]|uniref:site-specific DNA-methyltransferase (adenine-specific) n=1 Tax=Phaeobacter porticola TaxID=1844006 RepID=A0A1L3I818_9RHOB|nr:site-specific DNA-methyltransferase [Phaeobacter porticola]APG48227.1 modification methylase BabI [Phaeobacter porticola]
MPTLQWLTRDEDVRAAEKVPYRLLEEDPALGYGDRDTGNMLIQGDNLDALKALLPYYAGQVKCIYIDPPYNTGSAFEHYDDNLEHSKWLAMMWPRLELLRDLLAEDGSIWVSIDDREGHYLKVMMDEVFGRSSFIANVIWQKLYTVKNSAKYLSDMHDHVLCYAKNREYWSRNLLPRSEKSAGNYSNQDDDPRGPWTTNAVQARNYYSLGSYSISSPTGRIHRPPSGTYWRISEQKFHELNNDNRIWWGKGGDSIPRVKKFLTEAKQGIVPATLWAYQDAGTNAEAKQEIRAVADDGPELFVTPKPEKLLQQVLHIATNPGDIVLDSFLGSGTAAAVAQKMGRRYIGIEMGDHAVTHCAPRLQKVTDGEQGGISTARNWQGGGGFRFYRLGSPVFTEEGQIQPDIHFPTLAAHIWFAETGQPWTEPQPLSPFLGAKDGRGFALLYNGILGDKSVNGGNVLTRKTLAIIRDAAGGFDGPLTIYGERTVLADASLDAENIVFKQTPYDVRARK